MRWDRFFDDLEDQIASEWEAERAALESEGERLRLAHLTLQERLTALAGAEHPPVVVAECEGGSRLRGRVCAVGVDWIGWNESEGPAGMVLVAQAAIQSLLVPETDLIGTARALHEPVRRSLNERMTLGFVLRDLARRRLPVTVRLNDGRTLIGTIDRAMRDHVDLALHDRGTPRRPGAVDAVVMIALAKIAWVRIDDATAML